MSTHKSLVSVVQRAVVQTHSLTLSITKLVDLYLVMPGKQRNEQFVSTARAAKIAGVSQRTIQLWIDNGTLSAVRIGNNYKVCRDSLREHMIGTDD